VSFDGGVRFWEVSSGHVERKPLSMALMNADVVGLWQHWCRYVMRSALVVVL
jgi:hypothetical protein